MRGLLAPALGSCSWLLLLAPALGSCSWLLLLAPALGSCAWLLRLAPALGSCAWLLRLAPALGLLASGLCHSVAPITVPAPHPNPHFLRAFYASPSPAASIVYAPRADDSGLIGVIRLVARACLPPYPSIDAYSGIPGRVLILIRGFHARLACSVVRRSGADRRCLPVVRGPTT
jgi:hypothetical protein